MPSAATSPALAVTLTIVLALLHAWQRRGVVGGPIVPGGITRVALITGATLAHAVLQPTTGFIPTATLLFAAGAAAMGAARPAHALAMGATVAVVIAVVFAAGLGVPLPMGAWTR
jgi:hypothetical protein